MKVSSCFLHPCTPPPPLHPSKHTLLLNCAGRHAVVHTALRLLFLVVMLFFMVRMPCDGRRAASVRVSGVTEVEALPCSVHWQACTHLCFVGRIGTIKMLVLWKHSTILLHSIKEPVLACL